MRYGSAEYDGLLRRVGANYDYEGERYSTWVSDLYATYRYGWRKRKPLRIYSEVGLGVSGAIHPYDTGGKFAMCFAVGLKRFVHQNFSLGLESRGVGFTQYVPSESHPEFICGDGVHELTLVSGIHSVVRSMAAIRIKPMNYFMSIHDLLIMSYSAPIFGQHIAIAIRWDGNIGGKSVVLSIRVRRAEVCLRHLFCNYSAKEPPIKLVATMPTKDQERKNILYRIDETLTLELWYWEHSKRPVFVYVKLAGPTQHLIKTEAEILAKITKQGQNRWNSTYLRIITIGWNDDDEVCRWSNVHMPSPGQKYLARWQGDVGVGEEGQGLHQDAELTIEKLDE